MTFRTTGTWPLPWKLTSEDTETPEWCEVVDANGDAVPVIIDMETDETDKIAAVQTILAAVNHAPALLAAARAVVERWDAITRVLDYRSLGQIADEHTHAIDALRAAVEGSTPS